MIKKLLLTILAAVATVTAVSARDTEVSVSYGALPAMKNIDAYNGGWKGVNPWGSVSFTIEHRFADRLKIGLSYTLSTASTDNATPIGGGDLTWHALMVNGRYEWFTQGNWRLYSHAGIGVIINYFSPGWMDSYNTTRFAFQASPIGFEYDLAPAAGVFAEAGYGVQGIIKAGIRIGF